MPMTELHTAPALSRLCVFFFFSETTSYLEVHIADQEKTRRLHSYLTKNGLVKDSYTDFLKERLYTNAVNLKDKQVGLRGPLFGSK